METFLILIYRTVLFYLILMLSMRLVGKRQLGDAEPADLVVTVLLSELAATPLQNLKEPILKSLLPIGILVLIEFLIAEISLKNIRIRKIFQGRYNVLIEDGKINQQEMKKAHVTVDELLEEIRINGGISVDDVRYCILETSGKMSVILKDGTSPVSLPVTVVSDGKIVKKNLSRCNLEKEDIYRYIKGEGEEIKNVFWMYFSDGKLEFIRKSGK